MLLVEQFTSGHAHTHEHSHTHTTLPTSEAVHPTVIFSDASEVDAQKPRRPSDEAFDLALRELEGNGNTVNRQDPDAKEELSDGRRGSGRSRAFPLTLGLVVHSLADGLALGASALPRNSPPGEGSSSSGSLSLVVFLALIVHKAPTALALSMSLLSTSLSRSECRKHLAVFSASTPIGAILSFAFLSIVGSGAGTGLAGLALLISGGTFLYVATVLQPTGHAGGGGSSSTEMNEKLRASLVILGMFLPFTLGLLVEHDH